MTTKKQTTNPLKDLVRTLLQQEQKRQQMFAGIGIIIAASVLFFGFHSALFFVGIITATIVYFRLLNANIEIESKMVRLGWAAIMFAVFYLPPTLLTLEKEITMRAPGILVSLVLCIVLYSYIPMISYHLKLNDQKEGWSFGDFGRDSKKTRYNGSMMSFIIYGLILSIWGICENEQRIDAQFAQQPYISVIKWEKELRHGNTIYIIDCEKGKFSVSPYAHPEIRDINPNTKVRILTSYCSYNGLLEVKRLEIKNR